MRTLIPRARYAPRRALRFPVPPRYVTEGAGEGSTFRANRYGIARPNVIGCFDGRSPRHPDPGLSHLLRREEQQVRQSPKRTPRCVVLILLCPCRRRRPRHRPRHVVMVCAQAPALPARLTARQALSAGRAFKTAHASRHLSRHSPSGDGGSVGAGAGSAALRLPWCRSRRRRHRLLCIFSSIPTRSFGNIQSHCHRSDRLHEAPPCQVGPSQKGVAPALVLRSLRRRRIAGPAGNRAPHWFSGHFILRLRRISFPRA